MYYSISSNHEIQKRVPSSLLPHPSARPVGALATERDARTDKETFQFPPSVQIDLFNYLKPHQQKAMKPYLRIVKHPYQEKLCTSLLDYLEGHGLDTLEEPVLATLQEDIVQACNLRPLTTSRVTRPLQGLLDRIASIGRGKPLP